MPVKDTLLALMVMFFWGINFVIIDEGLKGVPPLLFVALRCAVVVFPAVLFIPRPNVPWLDIALVGGFMSLGQFGLMYTALAAGMPPGLASLVLQIQAAFTVILAAVALRERPAPHQVVGVGLGLAGLAIVAAGRGVVTPWLGLALSVGGAAAWAAGNVASRRVGVASGLSMVVWSSMVVPVPLLLMSLVIDGPADVGRALTHLTALNLASTAYTAVVSSLIGFGIWNSLLARHQASAVAPFSLLVPPIGIATAWIVQGERPTGLAVIGGVVLLAGVAFTSLGARLLALWPVRARPADEPA